MTDKTYNGWTNYATWRVNLEVLDGLDPRELFDRDTCADTYYLSKALQDYVEEIIYSDGEGLAVAYAIAFIDEVDFYSIAEHMQEDYDLCVEEEEEV